MKHLSKKYLSSELKNLSQEINNFKPTSMILHRDWTTQMKNKLKAWMYNFLYHFDILVNEFDYSKLTLSLIHISEPTRPEE
jgi:hypothetical protein